MPRAKAIVAKLAAAGHPITWESVLDQKLQDGATVGRPHIATLVAAGVVTDRTQAFDTLLHDGSEFFVGHYYVNAPPRTPSGWSAKPEECRCSPIRPPRSAATP